MPAERAGPVAAIILAAGTSSRTASMTAALADVDVPADYERIKTELTEG